MNHKGTSSKPSYQMATPQASEWLNFSIDSCKLRIPIRLVKQYPQAINDRVMQVSETTGEIYKTVDQKSTSINTTIEDASFIAGIEMLSTSGNFKTNHKEPYLTLKITSKLLGNSYFAGIAKSTVQAVYDAIIGAGFDIPYTNFLNAELTDTDFKADVPKDMVSTDTLKSLNDMVLHRAKGFDQIKKHNSKFKKNNTGVWFSNRDQATTSYPYIKIYDKTKELLSKSIEFYHSHLAGMDTDYWRLEYTIKGKAMFDKYGLPNTLNEILETDNETTAKIAKQIWSAYMRDFQTATTVQTTSTTLEGTVLELFIPRLADDGFTQNQIIDMIVGKAKTRPSKLKWTEKIESIFAGINRSDMLTKERLKMNQNVEDAMQIFAMV